jgi:hypothetical protein
MEVKISLQVRVVREKVLFGGCFACRLTPTNRWQQSANKGESMKRYLGAVMVLALTLTALAAPARLPRGPAEPMEPPKRSFRIGDTVLGVNDTLNQNDAVYMGRMHKVFLVEMEAGKTYQIDMVSTAFDSYLFFESPGKMLLAQDDDGGGYPDARIIHKATETGKFRIIASHFGNAGVLGQFNITVRLTDGTPLMKPDEVRKDK